MDNLKEFWLQYKGAIIGAGVAILILFTRLYELVIGIVLIVACMYLGNYVQQNKNNVKDRLKKLIDRM